jgi:hypothetical protein
MSVFQTEIRRVCLVGPSIDGKSGSPYLWVAYLAALYDRDASADHGAMRNPSLRVLAEAAEPRTGIKYFATKQVDFLDPKLLSVAVRPQDGGRSSLFFAALPNGQQAKAISRSIGNRREEDAFSVVTAVPALAQTVGKWPDKTSEQLQVPPLRLAAGTIPVLVSKETDQQNKNRVGYWTLLQATKDGEGFLSLFSKQASKVGVFVNATPGPFKVLKDGLDIPDDEEDPNSKESGKFTTEKETTSGNPPRFAIDLTPEGIEFDATLRFSEKDKVNVRLRLEARGKDKFVLVLLEEKILFFRNGLDQVAADLRRNDYPVALDLRPGTPRIVWTLEYNDKDSKLTLPSVSEFSLESDSVCVSLLGDPPSGAAGRTVARLSNPQASVSWGGTTPLKISVIAGDEKSTAAPVAVLGVGKNSEQDASVEKKPKRFDFQLGKNTKGANPTGDVDIVVDASVASLTGSVFFALERGVAQLPRPSEKVSIPAVGEQNAFEGLVHLKSKSLEKGVSTVTFDAAIGANVDIAYDRTQAAVTKVETKLYGVVGVLDGYVWAAAASPSGEEIVPTLDNGPISLRSLPVLFGACELVNGYKGTITPVTGKGSVKVTIEALKGTGKYKDTPKAVIWAPHPKTVSRELPPVVAAVSMTRTVPNATEPSRTRDLVPTFYEPDPKSGVVKLTLAFPEDGSGLPFGTVVGDDARFGWPDADVPLAAVTLPGVEYAATNAAEPTLRFDLPLLDDFHASATPRRKREEAAPRESALTAETLEELKTFWKEQSRRRRLMLLADDIFFDGFIDKKVVGKVAMPFEMSDTVEFKVENGSNPSLPLGAYTINGGIQFGESALAGLSAVYSINPAAGSKLERGTNRPINVTGFATAPYEVTIGETRPAGSAAGNAWQDTRGHAFAKTFTKTTHAILRQTHFQNATDAVERRTLITSLQATEVQIAEGVKALFAFRDLPTTKIKKGEHEFLEFNASNELPADPYSRTDLPLSVCEWRHYQASVGDKPTAHVIEFGLLRLKPLRLKNALFSQESICKRVEVEYRVDLPETLDSQASSPACEVPYGPDDVYRTGSIFSVTYGDGTSPTLTPQENGEAGVDFRVAAEPSIGTKNSITVDVSLGLKVEKGCLVIAERRGTLELCLFGSDKPFTFKNNEVKYDANQKTLTIQATPDKQSDSAFVIKSVTLTFGEGSSPKLDIDASLTAANSALQLDIGKKVNFYGIEISADGMFVVDHATGVVSVKLSDKDSKPVASTKSLARGFPAVKNAIGSMVFALDKLDDAHPHALKIGAARVDLHIQGKSESEFDARFLLQVENNKTTRRRLTVTLGIEAGDSIISWPTAAVGDDNVASKAVIEDLMFATALVWKTPDAKDSSMIQVAVAPTNRPVIHSLHPTLKAIDIPENTLQQSNHEWTLSTPLRIKAVTKHILKMGDDKLISWTAIDDMTLIDVECFVKLATKDEPTYSFSPRYCEPYWDDPKGKGKANPNEVPAAGIVKTAPFGRAFGNYLQKNTGKFKQGLALVGGAVHEAVLEKNLALTFGLPWIRFINGNITSESPDLTWPLPSIPQASATKKTFTVSLFDLAAAVPHQRNGFAPYPISVRGQRVVALMGELMRLKVDTAILVADLAFASNLPAYPSKVADMPNDPVVPDFNSPIFWRTLMALKRLFESTDSQGQLVTPQSFFTVFGDPASERAVRIDLVADNLQNGAPPPSKARVFVLDRQRVEVSDLPATLPFDIVSASADAHRRVLLDARTAIADPLVVKVARAIAEEFDAVKVLSAISGKQNDKQEIDLAMEHHEGGIVIDPIRRQVVATGRALRPTKDKTIYPEPSLGWPELGQLGKAVESSLKVGEEMPIQDSCVAWAGRARRFGGTLVASKGEEILASLSDQTPAIFQTAAFLAVGRRVIFNRNAEKTNSPTVTAPPDRALTPVPPRARAPLPKVIEAAFAGDVDKLVGNFLPGHYEFVSTGVRPGAMVFEHTGVLRTSNASGFDSDHARFGRPAERAPVVWTQGRAPRSTGLPKINDLDLRRRTFIGENIVDAIGQGKTCLRELALLKGSAGVIRYQPSATTDGSNSAFANKTVAIFVRVETQLTELDPDFPRGKIKLVFERPLPTLPNANQKKATPLYGVLGELGFLPGDNRIPPIYSLTVGDTVVRAGTLKFDTNDQSVEMVTVTIAFEAGFGAIRHALVSATPDTQALLHIGAGAKTVSSGGASAESPPRTLSIHLPVLPAVEPYLPIPTATLAFGDPAYDRELAGPAKTAVTRDQGAVSMLSLDRPVYDVGETIHFAVGNLETKFLDPANLKETSPATPWKSEGEWTLLIEWLPKPVDAVASKAKALRITDTIFVDENGPTYKISGGKAYGVSIAALRMMNGTKPTFKDGDRLSFIVNNDPKLTVAVTIVDEPVIAPSPAVYSLVTLDTVDGKKIATPILFASAPLPTTLEFPDLLTDLARGHVRRRGLFVWQFVPRTANPTAALVKIDRTGGGQIPTEKAQFVTMQ